jgi:hypothetical protein
MYSLLNSPSIAERNYSFFREKCHIRKAIISFLKISVADPDPNLFHFTGSGSVTYSMSRIKSTGRENLTKSAFWLGPGRPTDKEK